MDYEVDIIPVGEGSHSGDALAIRFGSFHTNPNDQKVVIIDGGFQDSGQKLIDAVKRYYKTEIVDLVISTHPDRDHLSGLHLVLEQLKVKELWIHQPWTYSREIQLMAESKAIAKGLTKSRLEEAFESAYDLVTLAKRKGILIKEPFQGLTAFGGIITVLGPSNEFYLRLIKDFEKSTSYSIGDRIKTFFNEIWHREELVEPEENAVSSRNNSSAITLFRFDTTHFLFCGDAGVEGLRDAVNYIESGNYHLPSNLKYFLVPHHGSKRNLGPLILDRIVGPKRTDQSKSGISAIISAAPEGRPSHPSQRVINALIRRGTDVKTPTCGTHQCFWTQGREGWGIIGSEQFIERYEED